MVELRSLMAARCVARAGMAEFGFVLLFICQAAISDGKVQTLRLAKRAPSQARTHHAILFNCLLI
jgi:hypothetical protein